MLTWLLNNMDEKVSVGVMFLKTIKKIWDTLNMLF